MKCVLEFEATGCNDCILRRNHTGHGEGFDFCSHPNHGREGYGDVVEKDYQNPIMTLITPDWCPFGLGDKPTTTEGK